MDLLEGVIINALQGRRRLALFTLFLLPGLAISSWVTRTPAIRDLLGASPSEMGLVLLGLSAGSMLGILASGPAVARLGARPVMIAGTLGVVLSMPTIGIGASAGSSVVTMAGLFLFGLGMGGGEIAMNVEGADIEKVIDRPVLPALHGFFSLGTVVGASLGIAFTATGVPVVWHLISIGIVAVVVLVIAARSIPAGTGRVERAEVEGRRSRSGRPVWKDSRLLLIAAIVLAMALAEGTAGDWLPLVMVDGHGFGAATGSAVYAVFAAAMTLGRFTGGTFISRYGRAPVLRASILAGVAGMALVIFVDSQWVAAVAVVLWGLGASLGFPMALSAAGESGADSARRVSLAATVGYVAFLVGPPVIGFVGEHYGLRTALILPMVLVAASALITSAVAPPKNATVDGELVRQA